MRPHPERFRTLLSQAIYRIRANTGKPLSVIQDEIGYALGREGESYIRYLRKGNLPSQPADAEHLAAELVVRHGLDARTTRVFLQSAGHPQPEQVAATLFLLPGQESAAILRSPTSPSPHDQPFIVGPPIIQPHRFFGRGQELYHIFGWISRFPMSHGAIIGPRRAGKTSLLHYVRTICDASADFLRPGQRSDWLAGLPPYRWVWIDFQDVRMRRLGGLLRHMLASLDLPQPEPCTLDAFMDALTGYDWTTPVVVLMDELSAGVASPELDLDFWWSMRSLLNTYTSGRLAFVIAAHESPMMLAAEEGKTSPFFNMFNSLPLGPLRSDEAQELIDSSPIPFTDEDRTWIVRESHGWPCLVQLFCQARLVALELEETGDGWKSRATEQLAPFRHLLQEK